MAQNLSPIQILMLGLAGYGGYRQGKQQRADELGEISRKDAQQKFENEQAQARLTIVQEEAARAAAAFEAKKKADALALYEKQFGPMSPYLRQQQDLLANVNTPQGLFAGARDAGTTLPPEAIEGGLAALFAAPTQVPRGGVVNRYTGQASGGYNTQLAPVAGGQQKSPAQLFDPADVAKIYMPAAIASYKKLYPEGTENPPDFKEFWQEYMAEMAMFAGVQTANPNTPPADPPPPGTQWQWIDDLGDWAPVPTGPAIGNFSDQPASPLLGR